MTGSDSSARIVLASAFLADYPQGGGHWSWFLQYLLGLRALGHEVFVLELLRSSGDPRLDDHFVRSFFERLEGYGCRANAALLLAEAEEPFSLESATVHGLPAGRVREIAESADLLWNLCGTVEPPLLSLFRRRVLIDTDPGIYQLSALEWDMGIDEHEVLFTVGANVGGADCEVPTLGRTWHAFRPFVHLPACTTANSSRRAVQVEHEEFFSRRNAFEPLLNVVGERGVVIQPPERRPREHQEAGPGLT